MSKTTIVIPNYNGIEYIEACLLSIPEEIPVIVVDNGSVDGSAAIVQERFPAVKLIRFPENYGFSAAVNEGIESCETEYVLLLNNDTKITPDFVTNMEKALDNDRKAFSAAAKMVSMYHPELLDGAGDQYCLLGWAYARGKARGSTHFSRNAHVFSACAGAAIYRTSILKEIGLFDINHFAYLEDLDVGYRGLLAGYHNLYAADAIVYHAGSASTGSRHNPFKVKLSAQNSVYVAFKNMPLLQYLINLPFLLIGSIIKFLFFLLKGMGGDYARGFWSGIKLCVSKTGREHKVPFAFSKVGRYLMIEGFLLRNTFGYIIMK